MRNLKQELTILRVDHSLMDLRVKNLEHTSQGNEEGTVRLNLINHVLALFHDKFACNIALRNPVFRWESCKGSV